MLCARPVHVRVPPAAAPRFCFSLGPALCEPLRLPLCDFYVAFMSRASVFDALSQLCVRPLLF
jgi:hypothetical protein